MTQPDAPDPRLVSGPSPGWPHWGLQTQQHPTIRTPTRHLIATPRRAESLQVFIEGPRA